MDDTAFRHGGYLELYYATLELCKKQKAGKEAQITLLLFSFWDNWKSYRKNFISLPTMNYCEPIDLSFSKNQSTKTYFPFPRDYTNFTMLLYTEI